MYKNYFSFPGSLGKTFKDSYKLLIMSCVLCSDDFFIKRLISKKKRKKERESQVHVLSVFYPEVPCTTFH